LLLPIICTKPIVAILFRFFGFLLLPIICFSNQLTLSVPDDVYSGNASRTLTLKSADPALKLISKIRKPLINCVPVVIIRRKNSKYQTIRTIRTNQKFNHKITQKKPETRSISLTQIYMSVYFPGLVQILQLNVSLYISLQTAREFILFSIFSHLLWTYCLFVFNTY
jgi:hypothetical protein